MNSDKERKLFEEYGWLYNYAEREWVAPDGYVITTDDIMKATDEWGPNVEIGLLQVIATHGKLNERTGL